MNIKILGSGCKNCIELEENIKAVVEELGLQAEIEKIKDLKDIVSYGVMRTPGLVVDQKVKFSGRVPDREEIKFILQGD